MLPKLKDIVHAPAERGNKAYVGTVVQVGEIVDHNHLKVPFVWTTVQHPSGSKHVWPSHRIGFTLTDEDVAQLSAPRGPLRSIFQPPAPPAPAAEPKQAPAAEPKQAPACRPRP